MDLKDFNFSCFWFTVWYYNRQDALVETCSHRIRVSVFVQAESPFEFLIIKLMADKIGFAFLGGFNGTDNQFIVDHFDLDVFLSQSWYCHFNDISRLLSHDIG